MATKKKVVNMETADEPAFNVFTKSYKIRYVVHAARKGDKLTICGRGIDSRSTEPFDRDLPGSCQKCQQKMDIEMRIHPGWKG
jgi:hypothetical protein